MSMPFALPSTSFLHIPQQIELTSLLHSLIIVPEVVRP